MTFEEAIVIIETRPDLELMLYLGDGTTMTIEELDIYFNSHELSGGELCVDVYRHVGDDPPWWVGKLWWPKNNLKPGSVHPDLIPELLSAGGSLPR